MKIKIYSTAYFIIFSAFSYLQFNDPDPIFWVLIYGMVAMVSLLRVFKISRPKIFLILTIVLIGISFIYIPGFIEYLMQPNKNEIVGEMVYQKSYIEETREFIGLWMAAGSTFHQYKMKG